MLEKSMQEFVEAAEQLVVGAVREDEFVKIHTDYGNAVLISEAEWNILVEAMAKVLHDA